MAVNIIRKFLMKKLMKPNAEGIMKIPEKGRIDFSEHFIKERLFTNGIDDKLIKNERQLENILQSIDEAEARKLKQEADRLGLNDPKKNKFMKEGEVIEVDFDKGRWNKAQGGRTGLSYLLAEDTNERVPLAGGGSGKPPINFYVDFSGSGGKEGQNIYGIEGLNQKGYDYGGTFAADTTFPFFGGELSVGGELGIGRNKRDVDYKGQPIDFLSSVGEKKLGDDWNVGMKWRKKFAGGSLVKGANWLIKSLRGTREQLKTMNMSPGQLKYYLDQIDDQIKHLEAGGPIPEEVIQTIRKDPKFKSVWQNQKSADPDLREIEEVLLEYGQKHAEGGRIGLAAGGMGRRAFLKLMAALGLTGAAAKYGLPTLFKKATPKVTKELTQVPIKNIEGMPAWFKPLVNKVIKEGEDVTKQWAYKDRQIVHTTKLPDSQTDVLVTQDLDSGDVLVDIGLEKHGFASGKFGQPVRLEYKASELIEPPIVKEGKVVGHGKGTKTKEEFWVEEAEFTGGHPENVKFEESTINKFGEHESNFDEVEMFAKGKTKKGSRNVSESFDKMNEDIADRFANYPDPDDYADGGIAKMLGE